MYRESTVLYCVYCAVQPPTLTLVTLYSITCLESVNHALDRLPFQRSDTRCIRILGMLSMGMVRTLIESLKSKVARNDRRGKNLSGVS